MTYFVIATKWDDEKKKQVKYIAGQFETYMNAHLFQKAYNEYYNATAVVKEAFEIVNS